MAPNRKVAPKGSVEAKAVDRETETVAMAENNGNGKKDVGRKDNDGTSELEKGTRGMSTRETNKHTRPGMVDVAKPKRSTAEVKADSMKKKDDLRARADTAAQINATIKALELKKKQLQEVAAKDLDHPPRPAEVDAEAGRSMRKRKETPKPVEYKGSDFDDDNDGEKTVFKPTKTGMPAVDRANERLWAMVPTRERTEDESEEGNDGEKGDYEYAPDEDEEMEAEAEEVDDEDLSDDEISGLPSPSANKGKSKKKVVVRIDDLNEDEEEREVAGGGGGGRKRAGSGTSLRAPKKKAKVGGKGGLIKDWEDNLRPAVFKDYVASTHASSRTSSVPPSTADARSQADASDGEGFTMGGISDDGGVEVLAGPLASSGATKNIAARVTVGGVATEVKIVHKTNARQKAPRVRWSTVKLPSDVLPKWKPQVIPRIRIRIAGSPATWDRVDVNDANGVLQVVFGEEHGFTIEGSILGCSANTINDWRGALARGGEKAVCEAIRKTNFTDPDAIRDFVLGLLGTPLGPGDASRPLLFSTWHPTDAAQRKGFCRHPLILEVLATHLHEIEGSGIDPLELSLARPPIAGLTLCCIAVYRALDFWKTGTMVRGDGSAKSDAMSEANWGGYNNDGAIWAYELQPSIQALTIPSWKAILTRADEIRKTRRRKKIAGEPAAPVVNADGRQVVTIVDNLEDD